MLSFLATFLITLLLSISAFAMDLCGKASSETKHTDVNWSKAFSVKVNNSIQDSEGVICVGVLKTNPSILSRIIYRDVEGRVVDADSVQLKKGIVLVSDKDLPQDAAAFLRSGQFVVVKVGEGKLTNGVNIYPINMRFLRNVSIGFSSNDYRELPFTGYINVNPSDVYLTYSQARFDEVEMNLDTFPVVFSDINFYKNGGLVKETNANNLKQVPSLF